MQYVKEKLHCLDSLAPGSDEHSTLLRDIMDHLHKHNDSEERKDLPLLEPYLGSVGTVFF